MNERIKQLLLQVAPRAGEDGEYLPSLHTPEDIEQFAWLIVEECADIVDSKIGVSRYVHEAELLRECSTTIKQHFGVEE